MTKQEKILAITSIAKDIADEAVYAARYNRKTLRIIRKKPFNKRKGQLMKVKFMFSAFMSAIQVATVLSQPVPKYPAGGMAVAAGETEWIDMSRSPDKEYIRTRATKPLLMEVKPPIRQSVPYIPIFLRKNHPPK